MKRIALFLFAAILASMLFAKVIYIVTPDEKPETPSIEPAAPQVQPENPTLPDSAQDHPASYEPITPKPRKPLVDREKLRKVRYDKPSTPDRVMIATWNGKKSCNKAWLHRCINDVLRTMPHLYNNRALHALVFETAAAETDLGRYKTGCKDYEDLGMFQIKLATARETLGWLKEMHPDIHKCITTLLINGLSLKDNLETNISFGAAMCATYYWRRCPEAITSTVEARGKLWKSQYNTHLGKGSVEHYIRQVEYHASK